MLFLGVAIFYEVLYLILQFVVTTIESWYLTLFPKKEKSLAGEIILVSFVKFSFFGWKHPTGIIISIIFLLRIIWKRKYKYVNVTTETRLSVRSWPGQRKCGSLQITEPRFCCSGQER